MRRLSLAVAALFILTSCGGGSNYASRGYSAPQVLYATGPIQKACRAQGRKSASRARCGCIQAVADRELSSAQQRRGASFFSNPHRLQELRQDGNPFWSEWKAYGAKAAQLCAAT